MKKFRSCIRLSLYIVFLTFWIAVIPYSFAIQTHDSVNDDPETIFHGRWKTDSGSLYEYVAGAMICIRVHDNKFRGWINQVAIKNFRLEDDGWYVDQAIRYHDTGRLSKWTIAKIEIINESSFSKIIIGADRGRGNLDRPQQWEKVR